MDTLLEHLPYWQRHKKPLWILLLVTVVPLLALILSWGCFPVGVSAQDGPEVPADLGDAPDSDFNHYGISNTAYFYDGTWGHFPTVWGGTPFGEPFGPIHWDASQVWLGDRVSFEEEADILFDEDGLHNILAAGADNADDDHFDDGWLNPDVPFANCQTTTLKVRVSVTPGMNLDQMFLNVWYDGNRDGDWRDTGRCQTIAYEWIVQNFPVNTFAISDSQVLEIPTELVYDAPPNPDLPQVPYWVRFSLSEQPAPVDPDFQWADGRGPEQGYGLGETEDYIIRPEVPPLVFEKYAETKARAVKPGDEITYTVAFVPPEGFTQTVLITDAIPQGTMILTPSVVFPDGSDFYWDPQLNVVNWWYPSDLAITDTPTLRFNVQVLQDLPPCEVPPIKNRAYLDLYPGMLNVPIVSNEVRTPGWICSDLGDAPDSDFNHYALTNTAYLTPTTPGHFPTVWRDTPQGEPSGPLHYDAMQIWLGDGASYEEESDILLDLDPRHNILELGQDVANLDELDDGWLNPDVPFFDCEPTTLTVRVSKALGAKVPLTMYLNVWFDGNRDGDWADFRQCADDQRTAFEWIVRDYVVNSGNIRGSVDIQVPTWLVLNVNPKAPAWVRFTLSEMPAVLPPTGGLADGRGYDYPERYELGETEDYIVAGMQPPEVEIFKEVEGPARVPPGGEIPYVIHVMNHGAAPALGLVITDAIPTGTSYISPSLHASMGRATYDPASNRIQWTLDMTDTVTETLHFKVRVWEQEVGCDDVIYNAAYMYFFPGTPPLMAEARTGIFCPDLGDAPDSEFNHFGVPNTAYSYSVTAVLGRYPTVWEGTPITMPAGPMHWDASQVWLGRWRSFEEEADIGWDLDGVHNILELGKDNANNDQFDDGWLNRKIPFPDCRETTLRVRVSRKPGAPTGRMFLNVWFDGRHDGDWDDWRVCPDGDRKAFEWIVRNFVVDTSVINGYQDLAVPTWLVMNTDPDAPAWVRFTLSETPVPEIPGTDIADGRGFNPPEHYKLGETEDYIYRPMPSGEPGEIVITKTTSVPASDVVGIGDIFTYSVIVAHQGGTAPAFTIMTDTLPAGVSLVGGPFVTEIISHASPLVAYAHGNIVGWQGHLSPGAKIRIDFRVVLRFCPNDVGEIVNMAVALQPDGSLIRDSVKIRIDCSQPEPPDLEKHILLENGALVTHTTVLPGQLVHYHLGLKNRSRVTQTFHIMDDLPPGVVAVSVRATSGRAQIINGGRTVIWDGTLGPGQGVEIWIGVKLRDVPCERDLFNIAHWFAANAAQEGQSNETVLRIVCHDLGDAPDSTNHFAADMMAYSPATKAHFPTVFEITPTQRGPLHWHPRPLHLGPAVSFEYEADIGPDVDGQNNIDPQAKQANLDKADDGVDLRKLHFDHCQFTRIPVEVSIDPHVVHALSETDGIAFLNVWLDSIRRDGDWNDTTKCPDAEALEHIVRDFRVNVAKLGPGVHTLYVPTSSPVYWPDDMAKESAWMRFTLSERPANKPLTSPSGVVYGDGRGYDTPFRLGETEDYIYRDPEQPGDEADPTVKKHGWIFPHFNFKQGARHWLAEWGIDYRNIGVDPAHHVQVVDRYDPRMTLVREFSFPHILPIKDRHTLTYNVGTLNPGQWGFVHIAAQVPFTTPPGTVLTNTVVITGMPDKDPLNNTAVFTVHVPLLPPRILYPRPGTDCTGTFTITGRAQPGVAVEVHIDGTLVVTVPVDAQGHWAYGTTLPDGKHTIQAVAVSGLLREASPTIIVIVDSSMVWSPLSLRFMDSHGHVIFPRDASGRMDGAGWRIPLNPGESYTASVKLCCSDPNAQVTLELGSLGTLNLTDPDGDRIFVSSVFTTPMRRWRGNARLCVICYLTKYCSDGEVTIDPEGTVFDVTSGAEIEGASVVCYEAQSTEEGDLFTMWNAEDYEQTNPQTTGSDGYYSFFTPPGTYQLDVTKSGYQPYRSWDIVVVDEAVHYDVPLVPELGVSPDYTVTVSAAGFAPALLEVESGAVIKWVNVDAEVHTTTSLTPTVAYTGDVAMRAARDSTAFAEGLLTEAGLDGWDSGLLDPGESYMRQLNTAGVYTYYDHESGLEGGVIVGQPHAADPSLKVSKDVTPKLGVFPGDTVTYTIVLSNSGGTALGVAVSDRLPWEVTFGGWISQNSAVASNGVITWTGDISKGMQISLAFTATLRADSIYMPHVVKNVVSFAADNTAPGQSSVAFEIGGVPALDVDKTVRPSSDLKPGDGVTYTIRFTNTGSGLAGGVVMSDVLPTEVAFGGWIAQGDAEEVQDTLMWTGDLASGVSISLVFTATVHMDVPITQTVVNTATVGAKNVFVQRDSASFSLLSGPSHKIYLPLVMRNYSGS